MVLDVEAQLRQDNLALLNRIDQLMEMLVECQRREEANEQSAEKGVVQE